VAYDDLGARGVREGLAVLAEAAVDDLRAADEAVGALDEAEDLPDQLDVLGGLGHDHLGTLEELHGSHRQQARVTGSAADERHPALGRGGRAGGVGGLYSRHAC
jgi:hypothetical protein